MLPNSLKNAFVARVSSFNLIRKAPKTLKKEMPFKIRPTGIIGAFKRQQPIQIRPFHVSSSFNVLSPRLGQPSPKTHPHLLKEGEITPMASQMEYQNRRKKFLDSVPEGSICIFPAAQHYYMTNDIPYVYRQNNDFAYLCGLEEPGSVLVLMKAFGTCQSTLFVRPRSAHTELWDGPRTGVERASEAFGIDATVNVDHLSVVLPDLIENATNIVFNDIPTDVKGLHDILKEYQNTPIIDAAPLMNRIRLVKTDVEIKMMRKSCSISANAFAEVMKKTPPIASEHVLSAQIEYECRIRGSQRLAYPPVVATGISCNTLHYVMNDSISKDGDLLLMDAGGEYFNYASDITRTWPTNGKFSPGQKAVYEAVLRTQKLIIGLSKTHLRNDKGELEPVTLAKLQRIAISCAAQELNRLGLNHPEAVSKCYPHMIGHFLGMDTHDVPSIGYHEELKPGMIITVEPGLYIPDEAWVPQHLRGIGVRIEDDVLITQGEPEVLTKEAPKEVDELEKIIGTAL